MELEDSIIVMYGILHHIFQIFDTKDVPVKQIIPCFTILLQKSENDIASIKKRHQFVRKTKNHLKNSQMTWRSYIQISQRKGRRKPAENLGIFCQNLGIKAYTLESYSNFKSKFSFNNGSICLN